MPKLIVSEKPSAAHAIAKALGITKRRDGYLEGEEFLVSWCVGHLVELAPPGSYDPKLVKWSKADLPILPKAWQYLVSPSTQKQFEVLRSLMARPDVEQLVCATDAGREGELIFRLVYHQCKCKKPFTRLWISSMEDAAIREGFAHLKPSTEYDALYEAALCRERADWLVGINATRLFSCLYGQPLNVGRVMTPTLAMTVSREAAIDAFRPEPFYTVLLKMEDCMASSERFKDKSQAEALLAECRQASQAVLQKTERKEKTERPPALYDLTSLQRDANRLLGYSAQQTLDYTQALYEKKLVTYPRTDSRYLTEDMEPSLLDLVRQTATYFGVTGEIPSHAKQVINNKKVSDHHAILPTRSMVKADLSSLPAGEGHILRLIAARLLAAVGEPYRYAETTVQMECAGHDAPAGEGSGSNGSTEGREPDEMGGPDEHLQGTGRGNPAGGTHQQLSFFPTEAEQIERIDRRAETEKVSAFSFSGEDIALAMASGSGFANGKERIVAFFQEDHTPKERAEFLKNEYGIGGRSWTFQDGRDGFLEYNAQGFSLRSYPEGQEQRLKWPEVEKRILILIAAGKYLDEPSKEEPIWEYNGVKERHPDNLVLYQMGDFYELYGEDARTAAAELDLNLFSRSIPGGGRVEMCGFPATQLEQTVERLRDKHDVTVSAQQKGSAQRREYTVLSIDHEAEQAIDAHEAEFGADGFRAFPNEEASKAATLRELHEQFKPIVVEAVIQDTRYGNVCSDGDRERAVIEGRAAVQRAVLSSGNRELLHLYSHIPEFRQRLTREVIDETYPKLYELLHPFSDADIDKAIQAWNGKIESKHAVVRYMRDHAREKDTAAWLAHEYDGSDGKTPFTVRSGSPEETELPWSDVQRRIAQLIKEDRFYTQVERDNLDDVDPVSIRETLADRGIVNGQVVEPEKLDNDPFIRQVVSDAEQAAVEPVVDAPEEPEPEVLSDVEYARRSLIPGDTAFDLDDRRFVVDQVDLDSQRVSLRDVTFAEATGFPIFRSEPIWVIRQYLEQEAAPVKPEKPLTAEDVTDIKVESSSYSAVSREKEYRLSCKINGVPDTLVYTVSQHDDGEGFSLGGKASQAKGQPKQAAGAAAFGTINSS